MQYSTDNPVELSYFQLEVSNFKLYSIKISKEQRHIQPTRHRQLESSRVKLCFPIKLSKY